jgi:hypothetical protein
LIAHTTPNVATIGCKRDTGFQSTDEGPIRARSHKTIVFFAGRPAAERAANAWAEEVEATFSEDLVFRFPREDRYLRVDIDLSISTLTCFRDRHMLLAFLG